MIKPYYEENGITIYHGDCRDILPELEPVDLVLTDPPYGICLNTDYLTGRNQLNRSSSSKVWDKIIGDDTINDYKFLFNHSKISVVFGANNFPNQIPFNPLVDGWICWDKRVTEEADRILGSPFELAVVLGRRTYKMIRLQHCGVKNADGDNSGRFHPTQKPIKLFTNILLLLKSQRVIDPFMGSGTTLIAAKQLGRKAIGIEIEEKYCEIAVKRLAQGVLDFAS
jgi:site-specific DNA-methyltransferase (adenine-specific)